MPDETVNAVLARTELETVYNYEGAAREIGVSRSTIKTWVMTGVMTPQYIESNSRRFLFNSVEVERMRRLRAEG